MESTDPIVEVPGSAFRVKLLQLWCFPAFRNDSHFAGMWLTVTLYDPGTDRERWTLKRAWVETPGESRNDQRENVPTWLLLKHGRCVKIVTVYMPNL